MEKSNKTDVKSGLGYTLLVDPNNLDFRKKEAKGRWETKREFDIAQAVAKREWAMIEHQENVIPFEIPLSQVDSTRDGVSSSYADYVAYCYRKWSMFAAQDGTGRSNLKSPMTFSAVESAVSEYLESNYGFNITSREMTENKLKPLKYAYKFEKNQGDFEITEQQSLRECIITGNSFEALSYTKKEREVPFVLSTIEAEERLSEYKTEPTFDLTSFNKELQGKPMMGKHTVVDYNGLARTFVSSTDVLIDESALCVHGVERDATDLIRIMRPSADAIVEELKNSKDQFILRHNIDKIKPLHEVRQYYNKQYTSTNLLPDIGANGVEVKLYWNKRTGKYLIFVNDLLLRDGPMNNRRGQIPIMHHKWLDWPGKLYGIGMAIVLSNPQAIDEVLMNQEVERAKRANSTNIVTSEDDSEVLRAEYDEYSPMNFIGLTNPQAINQIKPVLDNGGKMIRNDIRQDAVLISGVNPMASALPSAGEAVRNNVMSMQSTLKILKKGFKTYLSADKEAIRLLLVLLVQAYHEAKEIDVRGNIKYKKIAIPGVELKFDTDADNKIIERKIEGESEFEMTPEFLPTFEELQDMDIQLDFSQLLSGSQEQRLVNLDRFMRQVMPLLQQPQLLELPGVSELLGYFAQEYDVPSDIVASLRNRPTEDDSKLAMEQNTQMDKGQEVMGKPGSSTTHKYYHIMDIMEDFIAVSKEITENTTPEEVFEIERVRAVLELKLEHLKTDDSPKASAVAQTIAKVEPPQMMPEAGMVMPNEGTGMTPEGMAQLGGVV